VVQKCIILPHNMSDCPVILSSVALSTCLMHHFTNQIIPSHVVYTLYFHTTKPLCCIVSWRVGTQDEYCSG